jgi:predicted DNA-binding transcriptional regulator AlpA
MHRNLSHPDSMTSTIVSAPLQPDALLTEAEAAARLNIAPATMAAWRATKRTASPAYCRIGGAVRYRTSDIEDFIAKSVHEVSA